MRSIRRLPFFPAALAALALTGGAALAADPVGTWTLDAEAFRGELERMMQAELAEMTPEERAQVEPMMAAHLDAIMRRSDGAMEFRPDGTFLVEDASGRKTGRWTLDGDLIRLTPADDVPLAGTIEGDVMRLKTDDPDVAMEIVLNRR